VVAEHEDDLPRLAGGQFELDLMSADGRPAVRDGVGELPASTAAGESQPR
jgi:hypothetical protein